MILDILNTLRSVDTDASEYFKGETWGDKRFYYDAGDLIYKCCNVDHKANTASETWYIWKYTWDGTDLARTEGPLIGSVDDRTTLGWS